MKDLDAFLIAVVFIVWGALAILYATIDMIYMPPAARVWGAGSITFLVLAGIASLAGVRGRRRATGSQGGGDGGGSGGDNGPGNSNG